ncbi:hypothetical protein EW146_g3411 [Bondarzewia mesenterica]|uniref:RNA helicase n=1 Tax=Bondarzewia mesenterica TaxID=1095465 RepID=A0A4S4M3L2_9AGAM|nr:hypothetical protein EW146_g3411 [Bondarzewia mesenterica]
MQHASAGAHHNTQRFRSSPDPPPSKRNASKPPFTSMGLTMPVILGLKSAFPNIKDATDAQTEFIPAIMEGRDLFLKGRTGSGKSFGVVLALLSKAHPPNEQNTAVTSSLLIVPHRDLAFQFLHWIERIICAVDSSKSVSSMAQVLVRGSNTPVSSQIEALQDSPPRIIIGTPQAILDVVTEDKSAIDFHNLSTVVVDEADYLIDYIPTEASSITKKKIEQRMKRHPAPTKIILDMVYSGRMNALTDARDSVGLKGRRRLGHTEDSLPQLVMCSATFRSGLRQQLFSTGWIRKGQGSLIKVSGQSTEYDQALLDSASAADTGLIVGGRDIAHCVLVVSDGGDIKNVEGAVESAGSKETEVEQAESEIQRALSSPNVSTEPLPELPAELMIKFSIVPSPFHPVLMEGVAAAFAVDVPRVALLVLPASAPVQRAVYDLRMLGVNAYGLDLLANDRGRRHLLRAAGDEAEDNPTLLVSTLASTRGLDLPDLSHVFILGVPSGDRKVDSYLHIAGRVGRFGGSGKVISILRERYEETRPDGKKAVIDESKQLTRELLWRRIGTKRSGSRSGIKREAQTAPSFAFGLSHILPLSLYPPPPLSPSFFLLFFPLFFRMFPNGLRPARAVIFLTLLLASVVTVSAQQQSQSSTSNPSTSASQSSQSSQRTSSSASVTVFQSTSSVTITSASHSGNTNIPIITAVPSIVNVTSTITPTSTTNSSASSTSASATSSASATPSPIVLATKLDPAFGVLGALLILTGLPSAFFGHKNRWSSFFLIGFYTLSLVCFVLILKFGVLPAVNPPSKTIRGMFVLSSAVAGIAGGGIAIFFWKATKYFIGAWGGFALALWVQCFRNGGLIHQIGFRWIMYIGCGAVGFILCTIPKIHYHVILVSTAMDLKRWHLAFFSHFCEILTSISLRQFYIWNIGFESLFPKFTSRGMQFPVSQTIQIELGLIGAITLMGIAVQLRVLVVLHRKLQEIEAERKRRLAEDDNKAAERFTRIGEEIADWDKLHPTLGKHGRHDSEFSGSPLMKDSDGTSTPGLDDRTTVRQRYQSGLSEFMAAANPDEERALYRSQSPGVLPALDLGNDIQEKVPRGFLLNDIEKNNTKATASPEDVKRKEELLQEIETIRKSIEVLKTEPSSSGSNSRRPSFTSRRTLSYDLNTASLAVPSHLRPPRDPRHRPQSMDVSSVPTAHAGHFIGRPISAPLRDDDWDAYVHDRKLVQPPSGTSVPIQTTPLPVLSPMPRLLVPPAVQDALRRRQQRESMLDAGDATPAVVRADSPRSLDGMATPRVAPRVSHHRSSSNNVVSGTSHAPVTVLPPKRSSVAPASQQPRVVTYEELTERHREKLRELQAPLTQAVNEHAEIEAAKERWDRSKTIERQAVAKRQAERAAAQVKESERRQASGDVHNDATGKRASTMKDPGKGHSRALSADRLAAAHGGPSSSKKMSSMKVEDWQRYQAEVERPAKGGSAAQGQGRARKESLGVPFPAERRNSQMGLPPN